MLEEDETAGSAHGGCAMKGEMGEELARHGYGAVKTGGA